MARLTILEYPHPALRATAAPVTDFGPGLGTLVDDLLETLYDSGGIGLSAPQVGDLRAVLVMDLSGDASDPRVMVNPEILEGSRPAWVEESCLSLPGLEGNVIRQTRLRVRARDRTGDVFETELEDMHAVCVQHELDHLDGRLFIDRLPVLRRMAAHLALRTGRARRRRPAQ